MEAVGAWTAVCAMKLETGQNCVARALLQLQGLMGMTGVIWKASAGVKSLIRAAASRKKIGSSDEQVDYRREEQTLVPFQERALHLSPAEG